MECPCSSAILLCPSSHPAISALKPRAVNSPRATTDYEREFAKYIISDMGLDLSTKRRREAQDKALPTCLWQMLA